jgi:hypothetical protein
MECVVDPEAPINLIPRWMVEKYELKTASGNSFNVRSRFGVVAEIRAFCQVTVDTGRVTRQVTAYVDEFEITSATLRLGRPWLSDVQATGFHESDQFLILSSPELEYQQLEKLDALWEPPLEILTNGSPKPSTPHTASEGKAVQDVTANYIISICASPFKHLLPMQSSNEQSMTSQ